MTGIWPGLTQCTVNLGFDIDAQSNWIGRDPALRDRPVMMTAADYGPKVGVPRILNLMDEYGLKASFFIPGFTAEQYPDLVKEILARGHEVAGHGYMHRRPAELTLEGRDRRPGPGPRGPGKGRRAKDHRIPGPGR